ncbi:MAG: M48 family metalloprotease [Elusimicrobiota bacterium]|jgi:Zn-dependent protease with chaperone function
MRTAIAAVLALCLSAAPPAQAAAAAVQTAYGSQAQAALGLPTATPLSVGMQPLIPLQAQALVPLQEQSLVSLRRKALPSLIAQPSALSLPKAVIPTPSCFRHPGESRGPATSVAPVKAGVLPETLLDSGFRRNDEKNDFGSLQDDGTGNSSARHDFATDDSGLLQNDEVFVPAKAGSQVSAQTLDWGALFDGSARKVLETPTSEVSPNLSLFSREESKSKGVLVQSAPPSTGNGRNIAPAATGAIFRYPALKTPDKPYSPDARIRRQITVSAFLQSAMVLGSLAALYVGLGPTPLLFGTWIAFGGMFSDKTAPLKAAPSPPANALETNYLLEYAGAGTRLILIAAGKIDDLDMKAEIENGTGKDNVMVYPKAAKSAAKTAEWGILFGRDFLKKNAPAQLLATIAHELGHILLGHVYKLRVSNVLNFISGGIILSVSAIGLQILRMVIAQTAPLAWAASWFAASVALWTLAAAFGLRASRGLEFEADHFAAWLTDPRWLIEFFKNKDRAITLLYSRPFFPPWITETLFSDHPSYKERINELRRAYGVRDR